MKAPLRKRTLRWPSGHHPSDTRKEGMIYPALRAFHAPQRDRVKQPMPKR